MGNLGRVWGIAISVGKAEDVTVYGVRTSRVLRVLSWYSFLCSASTFRTRMHQRYVM
jgi:hypothetical protein